MERSLASLKVEATKVPTLYEYDEIRETPNNFTCKDKFWLPG